MNARRNAPTTPGDREGSDVEGAEDIAHRVAGGRAVAPAVTRVRASTAVRRSIFDGMASFEARSEALEKRDF